MDVCFDEYNYRESLLAHLIEAMEHSDEEKLTWRRVLNKKIQVLTIKEATSSLSCLNKGCMYVDLAI